MAAAQEFLILLDECWTWQTMKTMMWFQVLPRPQCFVFLIYSFLLKVAIAHATWGKLIQLPWPELIVMVIKDI